MRYKGRGLTPNRPLVDACEACVRLLRSRLPTLLEFGLSQSTPTAHPLGGGLSPRSLVLHLAQHRQPTDLGLAVATTTTTLCRSCAINHFRENSGTSRPLRHTGGVQVHPCDGGGGGLSPALHVPSMRCEIVNPKTIIARKRKGKERTPRSRCPSCWRQVQTGT